MVSLSVNPGALRDRKTTSSHGTAATHRLAVRRERIERRPKKNILNFADRLIFKGKIPYTGILHRRDALGESPILNGYLDLNLTKGRGAEDIPVTHTARDNSECAYILSLKPSIFVRKDAFWA